MENGKIEQRAGKLHAYASGSGALSFVFRDEDRNPTGERPTAAECISFIQDKITDGQGAWKDSEWVIVNQGPLTCTVQVEE